MFPPPTHTHRHYTPVKNSRNSENTINTQLQEGFTMQHYRAPNEYMISPDSIDYYYFMYI